MKELSEYVFDFASNMEAQLEANQGKDGWHGCTAKYLFREMFINMESARLGIENQASIEYVTKKLANVGNYAMMLIDNYDREHFADGKHRDAPDAPECDHSTYLDVADADSGGENDCDA